MLRPNANGGSDKRGDKKQRRISVTSVKKTWSKGKRCGNMVDILMILMKWKLMLILLVERFGGTCIRSCGPNLSSCSFLEKSVGEFQPGVCISNIIEIVLEMNHHTYWPWVSYLSTILYCLATLGFR